jgi:rare lipoprotein A
MGNAACDCKLARSVGAAAGVLTNPQGFHSSSSYPALILTPPDEDHAAGHAACPASGGRAFMMRYKFGARGRRAAAYSIVAGSLLLAGCADSGKSSRVDPKYGVRASPRVVQPGQPVPKGGGTYRVGKPYVVAGRTYYPEENRRYRAEGIASWYGEDFHGRLTANGEVYDMDAISAAHPTMPMPSYARVTNVHTGRSIIVRVNDRGPYHGNRVIDLSSKTAELLELRRSGTGRVRVEYVGPAPLEGSDDRRLLATLRGGGHTPASPVRVASARPFVPHVEPARRDERSPAPSLRYEPRQTYETSAGRGMAANAPRQQFEHPRSSDAAAHGAPLQSRGGLAPVAASALPPPPGATTLNVGRGLY